MMDDKGQDDSQDYDWMFKDSLRRIEEERQRMLACIRELSEPRVEHQVFTHETVPGCLLDPERFELLREHIMCLETGTLSDASTEDLLNIICGEETTSSLPGKIICSRHTIMDRWGDDHHLLVLTMPKPKAEGESFLACIGLLPTSDFYLRLRWRYFVVDGSLNKDGIANSFIYEYIQDSRGKGKGGFLLERQCRTTVDSMVRTLDNIWDEPFWTL